MQSQLQHPTRPSVSAAAPAIFDRKASVLADVIRRNVPAMPARVLVVGCGSGREAAQFAQSFRAQVVGIDVETQFEPEATRVADLRWGDATSLDFADGSFDFVYSFHALEHIPDYRRALREMRRVLRRDGRYCIGTPNRERWIGYLGSNTATLRQKLLWNLNDWKARLRGRFRNEFGAHAGFARDELQGELTAVLGPARDITLAYYTSLYARWSRAIGRLEAARLTRVLLPSVYFVGQRAAG
jgi:SAM-dependent methyltransferase